MGVCVSKRIKLCGAGRVGGDEGEKRVPKLAVESGPARWGRGRGASRWRPFL